MTALWDNIAKLIHSYEQKQFPTSFWRSTCSEYCSYYGICPAAQEGCVAMMKCKFCVNDVDETFFDYKVCGDCGEALFDAHYEALENGRIDR